VFELAEVRRIGKRPCVVETGTSRSDDWQGDGCSSVMFGDFCKHYDGRLYTVDISTRAIWACYGSTPMLRDHIEYVVSDSLKFLEWFNRGIDILYLDSYDWGPHQQEESQNHSLQEIVLAEPNIHPQTIVVIDDTGLHGGGKGGKSVPWLVERGWTVAFEDYQTVLVHKA
jgi:hypothetical protein